MDRTEKRMPSHDAGAASSVDMTDEEKRRDQLLRAAGSAEEDAAPRIKTTRRGNVTRIDVAPDAVVRPGAGD